MVQPKKHLGQHFLKDHNIARKIVDAVDMQHDKNLLEIGAGTGILTQYLNKLPDTKLKVVEIDYESADFLVKQGIISKENLYKQDFLKQDLSTMFSGKFIVIGNFPYNISSQIFFKILANKNTVNQVVCMVQKEVAERIAASPGNKTYGILSVLLQAYYNISYLFTVSEKVFHPPPKVKSAVIRLERNNKTSLDCNEEMFFAVVKAAFNQRRKVLGNSLKQFIKEKGNHSIFLKRPEQLGVEEFVYLTRLIVEKSQGYAI